jgi:hypothetical protein
MAEPSMSYRIRRALKQWMPFVTFFVPVMTGMIGGIWIVAKYLDERATTERRTQVTRLIEAQKPFLDRQTKLYFETAATIGEIMIRDPKDKASTKWADAEKRFWALYFSELAMVEHCGVDSAMKAFGDQLILHKNLEFAPTSYIELGKMAIRVAHALRDGMTESWSGRISGEEDCRSAVRRLKN